MAIGTLDQLRAEAGGAGSTRVKLAQDRSNKNLFLSHSKSDEAALPGAVGLFERAGARVYVDVADQTLRPGDPATAGRLRSVVQACRRLVVLATENTSSSRWIPWEMGLADGSAGPTQVAVFPLKASASASEFWAKQEYFELYARIEHVQLQGDRAADWAVRDPLDGKYWTLTQWLALTAPASR